MRFVLDAGHRNNSKDFGACGHGLKESVLALAIVKKLKYALEKLGVEVVLTRSSEDELITPSQRPVKAKQLKGDVLVSVHINAHSNDSASGIEVLYKTQKDLATVVCNGMCKATGAKNRGAKYRDDLAVLNGFNESILVECGFISNRVEANLLNQSAYQDKIVKGIIEGIKSHYKIQESDIALYDAVERIIESGIMINATAWNKLDNIKLQNVPALLSKFGGVDVLIAKGVISSADIWKNGTYTKDNVRSLLIKYSVKLG
ncbi:N-acetylmuramoyl-L-alanine amidase [Zhenhengia yiwuensis]|uniref:N-acetylmuramoyl-L-alanine amidase n=1 Tax=Zhenhengia yiwuensis TaxID=2763666 RepID=A0A926EJC1_9FIRM|nr:N-acetylmuramoyl-L-alanine amidase [Zhenhengia yiwuensis]MBC8579123.1 N-acetylmuramoyl-L-alanine amidase [Zhenhengia yiwuensis]